MRRSVSGFNWLEREIVDGRHTLWRPKAWSTKRYSASTTSLKDLFIDGQPDFARLISLSLAGRVAMGVDKISPGKYRQDRFNYSDKIARIFETLLHGDKYGWRPGKRFEIARKLSGKKRILYVLTCQDQVMSAALSSLIYPRIEYLFDRLYLEKGIRILGGRKGFSTWDALFDWTQFIKSNRSSSNDPSINAFDIADFFPNTNLLYTQEALTLLGIDRQLIELVLNHMYALNKTPEHKGGTVQGSPISCMLSCVTLCYLLLRGMPRLPHGMYLSFYIDDLVMISFCQVNVTEKYLQHLNVVLSESGWSFNDRKTETLGPGNLDSGISMLGWLITYERTPIRNWLKLRIKAPAGWLAFKEIKNLYRRGQLLKASSVFLGRVAYQRCSERVRGSLFKRFTFYRARLIGNNSTLQTRDAAYKWLRTVYRRVLRLSTRRGNPRLLSIFSPNGQ